jgi:hypothetical protein
VTNRLTQELIDIHVAMGAPRRQAIDMAKDQVKAAVRRSRENGTFDSPPNMGDLILQAETTDEATRQRFAVKRAEGVTDADIRWWWNMHDVERQSLLIQDEGAKLGVVHYWQGQGLSMEEGIRRAERMVNYGDPRDASHFSGEDRPLPIELKERVNRLMSSLDLDSREVKRRMDSFSSANAFIRAEMRAGRFPESE